MKILIVEDDFICSKVMKLILDQQGKCDTAIDGAEGVKFVDKALNDKEPYDLICLDIMMPNMNGHEALDKIRESERQHGFHIGQGAKILMTTALSDHKSVMQSFKGECDGYLIKPISKDAVNEKIKEIGLI